MAYTMAYTTLCTATADPLVWPDMKRPPVPGGIVRRTPGDKVTNRTRGTMMSAGVMPFMFVRNLIMK